MVDTGMLLWGDGAMEQSKHLKHSDERTTFPCPLFMCFDISSDLRACVPCVVGRVRQTSARFVDGSMAKINDRNFLSNPKYPRQLKKILSPTYVLPAGANGVAV